jgi:hypothetical protein
MSDQTTQSSSQTSIGADLEKKPGSYKLYLRATESVISPGDDLSVEVYISGFGESKLNKLVIQPSADIFDRSSSHATWNWGNDRLDIPPQGITILNHPIEPSKELPNPLSVPTEMWGGGNTEETTKPPITLRLKTKDTVRPGAYYLSFVFTYYDGEKWNTTSTKSNFTVRNILQRFQTAAGLFASIAAIATIISATYVAIEILSEWHMPTRYLLLLFG